MGRQWEIAQGQSICTSHGLESPAGERGGSTGLSVSELVFRALHKPLGLFFSPKLIVLETDAVSGKALSS